MCSHEGRSCRVRDFFEFTWHSFTWIKIIFQQIIMIEKVDGQYHIIFLIWSVACYSILSCNTLQPAMWCFPIPCIPFLFWPAWLMNEETFEMPAPTLNTPNIKVGTTTLKKIWRSLWNDKFTVSVVSVDFLQLKVYVCNDKLPFVLRWFWHDKVTLQKRCPCPSYEPKR